MMANESHTSNVSVLVEGLDFYTPLPLGLMLIYNIVSALAVPANILHLCILYISSKQIRLRKLPANYRNFLMVLGVSDLTLGVCRLIASNDAVQRQLLGSRAFCVTSSVIMHSCLLIGGNSILLVSIDRILALSQSVAYSSSWFVKHFTKLLVAVISSGSIMYITLATLFWDKGYRVKGIGACKMGSEIVPSLGLIIVVIMLVDLIVICAVYGDVLRRTVKSLRGVRHMRHVNRRNKDIAVSIGALLLTKVFTWLPIMSTVAARAMRLDCVACEWVGLITMACNPFLNPIIYGFTNRSYAQLIRVFRKQITTVTPTTSSNNDS